MMMMRCFVVVGLLAVSGCGVLDQAGAPAAPEVETVAPEGETQAVQVRPQARPDALPDAQPSAPEVSAGTLGRTVASLGNAAEPGLWLKTPLVQAEQAGTVFYPATNKSVKVRLIPIDAPVTAGSRMSLQAMQDLGAPLTGLPEVDVLAG